MPAQPAPRFDIPMCNARASSTASDDSSGQRQEIVTPQDLALSQSRRHIRPHRKTRQGCFNCKRRKVKVRNALRPSFALFLPPTLPSHSLVHSNDACKCPQNRPACLQCTRNGLSCSFPFLQKAYDAPKPLALCTGPRACPMESLSELQRGDVDSMILNLRFLESFVMDSIPHMPIGSSEVWKRDILQIAFHVRLFSTLDSGLRLTMMVSIPFSCTHFLLWVRLISRSRRKQTSCPR